MSEQCSKFFDRREQRNYSGKSGSRQQANQVSHYSIEKPVFQSALSFELFIMNALPTIDDIIFLPEH